MITTIYNVVTKYRTDTRGAKSDVDKLATSTDRLTGSTEKAQGAFARLGALAKTALAGAATLAVGVLTRHVGGLHSEIENAGVQIASVFAVNNIERFGKGLVRARGLMSRFRKAAIASPGESRDLLTIFGATAPALFRSGDVADPLIEQFATRGLAAAFTLGGGDIQTTGQQLSQILLGQGGADNKIFQALRGQLRDALGIEETGSAFVEQFNKIANSAPQRVFEALNKSLSSLDEANKEFGKTFTGLWGSMKETVNAFLVRATGPLFDEMKSSFAEQLGLAMDNDGALDSLADTIGQKLASAFRGLAEAVGWAKENLDGLILSASILGAIKVGSAVRASAAGGVLAKAGSVLRQGDAVRRTVGAGIGGGIRRGGGFAGDLAGELLFGGLFESATGNRGTSRAARLVGGIRDAPGRLRAAGARQIAGQGITFDTLGAVAGKAKGGLGALAGGGLAAGKGALAALGGAASTLATVLVPLIVIVGMVAGTFMVLKDDANEATQFLHTSLNELWIALDGLAGQFGFSGSGGFGRMLKSFATWLGTGVVGVLGLVVKGVELLVSAFSYLVTVLKGIAYGIGTVFDGLRQGKITGFGDIANAFTDGFLRAENEAVNAIRAAYRTEQRGLVDGQQTPQDEKQALMKARREAREEEMKRNDKPKTEINVKNEVRVETDADPDKIAFRTGEVTVQSIRRLRRSARGLAGFE